MNDTTRQFRDFFVSLKLTVVLLAMGMILVFAATLDQVNLGVWAVQEKYFRSSFVLWRVGDIPIPVFPGGYFIGGLLLINLITAHVSRFQRSWKKAGIQLAHAGVILLLLGELLSGLWQEEYAMKIDEGESKNYSESYRFNELAIIDATDPKFDDVVVIPEKLLARGEPIQHAQLPFRVVTKAYFPNADLVQRTANSPASPATAGFGLRMDVSPQPLTYKQNDVNTPAAYIELIGTGGSLGTWLVSTQAPFPQHFNVGGHDWKIALRAERAYKPFSLFLEKFSFDRYPGTQIPKNFSSDVRLTTPDGKVDRHVHIYMNNPLRYEGLTFYQADYDHEHEKYTVLQVVKNPSWILPYIACITIALGLVWQFGQHLAGFIRKRRATA